MRLSPHDDFGLRCLLVVARNEADGPVTIPSIAKQEGLGPEHTAKLMRTLRQGGLVTATRGATGGYRLARPADEITVDQVLRVLDGPLVPDDFCERHKGRLASCPHRPEECPTGLLWRQLATRVSGFLDRVTLADLAREPIQIGQRIEDAAAL